MNPQYNLHFQKILQKKIKISLQIFNQEFWKLLKSSREKPRIKSLRLHRLSVIKPPVWKIEVFADRSWQISMRIQGSECGECALS